MHSLDEAQRVLEDAPFIRALGLQAEHVAPGEIITRLVCRPDHQQHDGFIHAGVLGTMADHSAGAAAATLLSPGQMVLTAEYKLNLLRPAQGQSMVCEARVLKPGRTLTVVESEVWAESEGGPRKLVAKATVTLAVMTRPA